MWRALLVFGTTCAVLAAADVKIEDPDTATPTLKPSDCSKHSSCTECVSSSTLCDWCLDGHRCTDNTAEDCKNDILVTGITTHGPGYRAGPGFCPTINSTFDGTNVILIPSGVKKAIKVRIHVMDEFIVQTRLACLFNIEGREIRVNAQLLADTVYCEAYEFSYTSPTPKVTASFSVLWGGSKPLDNPNNIHLIIFRCNDMADNCATCQTLPEKFGCGWCQDSNRCEGQDECSDTSVWIYDRWRGYCEEKQKDPEPTKLKSSECSKYSSCTECVSSSSPCNWCVDGNLCTDNSAESCSNDILVTGVSRIGPSYRSGPGFCPTINSTSDDGTNEILVPFGVKKAIKVKLHNIGQFIVQTRFVCQFNIEGRVTLVRAQLLADTIYCGPVEFTYTSRAPNITASFAVIWGRFKPLDNPRNIHIIIYRCNGMADSCTACQSLPEKFDCGWCQSSGRCEVQDECSAPEDWLNRRRSCS